MTWELSIAGALIGVLVGMTGMGGGSLMTPMLILLFGFDPKTAVGTDILHGAVRHRQLGNVHVPLPLWMLSPVPGTCFTATSICMQWRGCSSARSPGC